MGFFDKRKKEQPVEETDEKLTLENTEITDVDGAERFSILVENVTTMLDGEGRVVIGALNGKISKDETVFIPASGSSPIDTSVDAIKQYLSDVKDGMRGTASTTEDDIIKWIESNK